MLYLVHNLLATAAITYDSLHEHDGIDVRISQALRVLEVGGIEVKHRVAELISRC